MERIARGGLVAQEFDVVILGGGPGGYAAALYGAAAGLSIGMIEEARVGGTCLHRGCIPAKELLQTAEVVRTVAGAKEFGVAAGSSPRSLPGFDFDGERILSSDHVLNISEVPARVAVIGGGAIGCEFASFLGDVGSDVTVLEALPQILTGVDKDAADVVVRA